MRVLVIGGSGAFSSRVVEMAAAAGHDVLALSRGQRPSAGSGRQLLADRSRLHEHVPALQAFAPDVVVDAICFQPTQAQDLVELFPAARRVVLISSTDVYGEDVGGAPVDESRSPAPATSYARGKLASERVLLDGLGARATVVRPSHMIGRGFHLTSPWSRNATVADRLRRGLPLPVIDGGRNLMTPAHALDVARCVLATFDNQAADGEVFNAVGGEIVTQRRYLECAAARLGGPAPLLLTLPATLFRRHSDVGSALHFHRPYSHAKAARLLGHTPQSTLETALAELLEHLQAHDLIATAESDARFDHVCSLLLQQRAELDRLLAFEAAAAR
jgi:nucleoside-diphosphate-sugar epimerase